MTTSKSVEQLAERVMRSFKRAKGKKNASLRTTRYANLINDLLQRENPRRDFVGDFVGVLAGLRECELERADALDIRDAVNSVFDDLWPVGEATVLCATKANVREVEADTLEDIAQAKLLDDPSPRNAIAYLDAYRRVEIESRPMKRIAETVVYGGTAA
jgi:hypothetical protein